MSTPPAGVYEHLTETSRHTGRPVREVALEWAHGVDGDWSWWVPAGDIVIAILNPHQDRASLDDATVLAVELMTDTAWPAWVRAALAWRYAVTVRRGYASEPDDDPDRRAWLTGLLEDWDEAEHMVWEEIAWPGPFADDATSQWGPYRLRWFELQERLAAQQVAWCRARLADPTVRGVELGLVLRRLWDVGELTDQDLLALAPGWRGRFLRQFDSDPFSGLGACVVYGMALAEFGIAAPIFEHIREHRRRWETSVHAPLVGWYGTPEEVDELWERALRPGADPRVVLGATAGRARLEGIPLARACDLAAAEAGRHDPFLRVALAHGGRPRLWARDIDTDPRRSARAAELAADDSLSEGFRAAAKGLQC
ncbi:hypothetical protein [Arachnia propionica]|uniref:Uncharacterized protein n=1 Tax=Arachnia propionica TaxID=1750 RepID=A0A3P1WUM5_9ACTN|nr:hypothetical protein [Arachnia propionica]RRD49945.1 hypothetical protein EII35_06135 [Arachnia propionica]